jgi:DNA-binding PadR family transcriptional regulator
MSQAVIGHFEQLVLTAILQLGDNAYGVTIRQTVGLLAAPKNVSLGSIYATLDRLEDKRFILSWLSDPTPARGGRSKRHYRLQAAGERALRESVQTAKRVCETVDAIWGLDGPPGRLKPAGQH